MLSINELDGKITMNIEPNGLDLSDSAECDRRRGITHIPLLLLLLLLLLLFNITFSNRVFYIKEKVIDKSIYSPQRLKLLNKRTHKSINTDKRNSGEFRITPIARIQLRFNKIAVILTTLRQQQKLLFIIINHSLSYQYQNQC